MSSLHLVRLLVIPGGCHLDVYLKLASILELVKSSAYRLSCNNVIYARLTLTLANIEGSLPFPHYI